MTDPEATPGSQTPTGPTPTGPTPTGPTPTGPYPTGQTPPGYAPAPPAPKRLVRRTDDKMIAGVCSGVADYLGVDVTLVRLLTVLGAIFGMGSLVVAYVVLWVVLPEA